MITKKESYIEVNKIMEQVDIEWEDRLHSLIRASRTSQMSYNDFIDCIVSTETGKRLSWIQAYHQFKLYTNKDLPIRSV